MKLLEHITAVPALHRQTQETGSTQGVPGTAFHPGRYALRFFAAMLVLTLVSRGISGAAMPQVNLTLPSQGTIVQQVSASATVTAGEGEALALPAGVTVDVLYASAGQSLKAGDAIVQLNQEQLQKALDESNATLARQKAQLAQLNVSSAPDTSAADSARQTLTRAQEDYSIAESRTQAAVDQADAALTQAQQAREQAARRLEELQQQADPAPSEEELNIARQMLEEATQQEDSARQTLEQAQNAREDSLLSAQRNLEDAQTALTQAESDYTQAQSSAALTAQSNAAQEQQLQLEIASTEECIALLTACMETDGLICAERDTQLLTCDLKEGQPCPESGGLRIAREDSELVAAFSLPAAQAENLAAGQSVTIVQGSSLTEATVRTAVEDTESGAFQVTAVLPEDAAGFRAGTAQAELIFSRTSYGTCLPVSAIRQDTQGSFVLTVEENRSTFGISYTARRVPVTVLEVGSDGQYAAVEGTIGGSVIASSDQAVSPGSSVRIAQ